MSKISVIIPNFNNETTLPRCLDSILNQTYKNFEIIIVDDGSTDKSLEVLRSYALKDKRIIIVQKPNGGVSSARNVGMKLASGDYVQFIDADDDIVPHAFQTLISTAQKTDADMISFKFKHDCWKSFLPKGTYFLNNIKDAFKFYSDFFAVELTWSKFIKRSVITAGFDENLKFFEGVLFYLANHKNINKVVVLEDEFYNYFNSGVTDNASAVNGVLKNKFWETKSGHWHKFLSLQHLLKKALDANFENAQNFIRIRLFDVAFHELIKLVDVGLPENIIALEMHNIFNEPAFADSAKLFDCNINSVSLDLCNQYASECCKSYESIKSLKLKIEPYYKYIELFFNIIAKNQMEEVPAFDLLLSKCKI